MLNNTIKELIVLNGNSAIIPELLKMIVYGVETEKELNKEDLSQYILAFSEISSIYLMKQTKKLNELEKMIAFKKEASNE